MTRLLSCTLRLTAWVMAHEDMPISCVAHAHVLNELAKKPVPHVLDDYSVIIHNDINDCFSARFRLGYKKHVIKRLVIALDLYRLLDRLLWNPRYVKPHPPRELWAELRSLANKAAELEA